MTVGKQKKISGLRTVSELQDIEQSVINPVGDIDDRQASDQAVDPVSGIDDLGLDLTPGDDLSAGLVSFDESGEETDLNSMTSVDDDSASSDSVLAALPDSGESFDFAGISLSDTYGEGGSWQSAMVPADKGGAGFDLSFADYGVPASAVADVPADNGGDLASNGDLAAAGDLGGGLAAPGAPGTLQTLANYLTTGFWGPGEFGGGVRHFNLTNSGTGSNNGTIYFNVSGFTGVTGAGTDADGLSSARRVMVRNALDVYGDVLGIDFVETTSQAGHVDLFFKDNASGAFTNTIKHSGTGIIDYSWVNIAPTWDGGNSAIGTYAFQTALHELGHAFGLGHQGNYNFSASYATDAYWQNDSWQASMMSYFDQNENTDINASYARLISPMSVDWIAFDDIYASQGYGTSNAFTGNTTWGFNTNIGASPAPPVSNTLNNAFHEISTLADINAFTIVDGGGIDTLDFSGFSAIQSIDLAFTSKGSTAATISDVGGLTGNMTIAAGTYIENAIGGSGNDFLFGNSLANVLTGNDGDDSLYGLGGNDTLNGSNGFDELYGGDGNDNLYGGSGGDVVYGGNGSDTIFGETGVDYLYGHDGNDSITGGADVDNVFGGAGDDTIYFTANAYWDNVDGGTGNDTIDASAINANGVFDFEAGTISGYGFFIQTLANVENFIGGDATNDTIISDGSGSFWGGGGNDTMTAGIGVFETLDGGTGIDTLITTPYSGNYVIDMTTGVTNFAGESFVNFENVTTGAGNDTVTGTNFENVINTNGGDDIIHGGGGDDMIDAGLGNDDIDAGAGNDTIDGGGGDDTINGGDGSDLIYGGDGVDMIYGGLDVDTIDAGGGDDIIYFTYGHYWDNVDGWTGNDTIDASAIAVDGVFDFEAGTITGYGGTLTLANVENFIGGNTTDDTIISDGSGSFWGGGGNDTMTAGANGGGLSETLDGGAGTDKLITTPYTGDLTINMITGATNVAGKTFLNFENATTGVGNDTITGTSGTNVINANGGDDIIHGGGGDDMIDAGLGNDDIDAGAGNDTIDGGGGDDTINGGDGTDLIYGGDGVDMIYGGLDVDTIDAGGGDDIIYFTYGHYWDNVDGWTGNDTIDASAIDIDGVFDFEAGTITGYGGTLTLANVENFIGGNTTDDTIISDGSGSFWGGGGNDTMTAGANGGGLSETLDGGAGTDKLFTTPYTGDLTINMITGATNVAGKTFLNFEDVTTGVGNDTITGTAGANTIFTGVGNDLVNGGLGDDTISGADGDDRLNGQDGGDTINGGFGVDRIYGQNGDDMLNGNDGNDIIYGGLGNDTVFGGEGNDFAQGNAGVDHINGNGGNDTLYGGGGNDTVNGGSGNDALFGQSGNDVIYGSTGNDSINGGGGNDTLNGNDGNDTIYGSIGDDTINGGAGVDYLHGGDGIDSISGNDSGDTIYGYTGNDVLHGNAGEDHIFGGSGNDNVYGDDNSDTVRGGEGNDHVYGGSGFDTLFGDAGNDTLNGGLHNDILRGGLGNDTLTGGTGTDRFNFEDGWGQDILTDFANDGLEKINLFGVTGITGLSDLTLTNIATDVEIAYLGNTILVQGLQDADLDNSDFIF